METLDSQRRDPWDVASTQDCSSKSDVACTQECSSKSEGDDDSDDADSMFDRSGEIGKPSSRSRSRSRSPRPHTASRSLGVPRSGGTGNLQRADTRRGLGPGGASLDMVPTPDFTPGTDWWAVPLWHAILPMRNALPKLPHRTMLAESLFSGLLTESFSDRTLGMDVAIQMAVDKKDSSRKFIRRNSPTLPHLYKDAKAVASLDYRGCEICGKGCRGPQKQPDLLRLGPPCQPYTTSRCKSGVGDMGTPREHSQWGTCFDITLQYLNERKPRGFILEEVLGFGHQDKETQQPYVVLFQREVKELGYVSRVVELNGFEWSDVQRPRFYVFGVLEELGGAKAVDWMVESVDEICRYRKMQPGVPIFPTGDNEVSVLQLDTESHRLRKEAQVMLVE